MKLYILGAGKYGREIEDVASQLNKYEFIGFFDDASSAPDVLGKCADFSAYIAPDAEFYAAFGNNETRLNWLSEILNAGAAAATIVHPTAYISPRATLGVGVAVLPKAVVNTYSVIKDGVMVNTGSIVDHDSVIGKCAHVCVGAIVKADNFIPDGMKIEAGVVIQLGEYKQ